MDYEDKKKLDDIHRAVMGDTEIGHEGLVKTVARHERWITKANLRAATVIGGSLVLIWIVDHVLTAPTK